MDEGKILLAANNQEITSKLYFGIEAQPIQTQDKLYSEDTIGGNVFVKENKNFEESNIDIELLFNAVFQNKAKIQSLFPNKKGE